MNTRASEIPRLAAASSPELPGVTDTRELSVCVIGPGRVGTALLAQLRASGERLRRELGVNVKLRMVVDSRRMWLDRDDDAMEARIDGAQTWRPADLSEVRAYLGKMAHALVIDCSASDAVADGYSTWLAAGIHVVTPNKLAMSGPLDRWQAIRKAARAGGAGWHYETTVGAGLPVVKTLRELLDTGDRLVQVEGLFSGTLAWLFHGYDGQRPFSELVAEAVELGYAEPDPRQDLGGMDVARKLVILAREAGLTLSLHDVQVESLVPAELADLDRDTFMQRLDQLDRPMARRHADAGSRGCVLRCVGRLDALAGTARVALEALPHNHALARASLADNVIAFHTLRYRDTPLVVQGPGAGPEVTAAGVFADLLQVARGMRTA